MYFRRKTADYFRSNFSSIQTLILRFGYLWFECKTFCLVSNNVTPEILTRLISNRLFYFRKWQLLEAPSSMQHWWLANNIEILHREIN